MPPIDSLCQRIEASVSRVVPVDNLACQQLDGILVLSGNVDSRQELLICGMAARAVPGVEKVVVKVKVK